MGKKAALYNLEICLRAALSIRKNQRRLARQQSGIRDIFLCLVDHFEPSVGQPPRSLARERMEHWMMRYPEIADRHRDADGRPPAHSFFYPWDEYDPWEFSGLKEICSAGFGEVELHLHHHDDTDATLRKKLREAVSTYHRQGMLPSWADDRPAFAFIHGNWALDNSRQENGQNFCGVNNELQVLKEEGCYADFTFPAWQHFAQPRQTNSLFYAIDNPNLPKSYDTGKPIRAGIDSTGDMPMIQGPLVPFFAKKGGKMRLAMDDGDIASYRRYTPERLDL